MSALTFRVLGVRPERHAATPTLLFRLGLETTPREVIHCVALRCQIRIEPQRRRYSNAEQGRLLELFGEVPRWGDTLRPFLWSNASVMVPGFDGATEIDLPVPCSYDLEIAGAKYLHGLDDGADAGDVPLAFLFSGSIFGRGPGGISVTQVSWSKDVAFRMPASTWRELMDLYFPNGGWLRLSRETLDALCAFKAKHALASWDQVLEALLREAEERAA